MIDDEELVALFKLESEERLQNLDQGLLRLESDPRDSLVLEELFREAHNLKGAARMLGALEVGRVAHRFEDILGEARRSHEPLPPARIDSLYFGLDAIKKLVREVISQQPAGVDVDYVMSVLDGTAPAGAHAPTEGRTNGVHPVLEEPIPHYSNGTHLSPPPASLPQVRPNGDAALALPPAGPEDPEPEDPVATDFPTALPEPAPLLQETTAGAPFRIETIRVEPHRLDALMMHSGELTVTRSRIARRLAELEQLVTFQEEWAREAGRAHRAGESTQPERLERLGAYLTELQSAVAEDVSRLEFVTGQLEEGIRSIRLLPFSTIFNLFPRMVRDLAREQGKDVRLLIEGAEIAADKRIVEEMKDPLMHMLRNAVDHGIERPEERSVLGKSRQATLRLRAVQTATQVIIDVEDDGRGIDLDAVRRTAQKRRLRTEEEVAAMSAREIRELIFAPGFSTRSAVTDVSGRGVGMDVVRKNVDLLKGFIEVESEPARGTCVRISLPLTIATSQVFLVTAAGQTFALPIDHVESARHFAPGDLFPIKGCDALLVDGAPITAIPLARLLRLPPPREEAEKPVVTAHRQPGTCIILTLGTDRLGVLVDELLDEQEIVLKPLGSMLKRVPNVAGATILGTGEVCMVLNTSDLFKSARKSTSHVREVSRPAALDRKQVVLVVEDSITTRTQEKRILEGAGYEVVTAVDGLDGYNKLRAGTFDAVISDIEMPNLDGLGLTSRIRQELKHQDLPIILVTSLATEESRRRGIDAGADAYLVKSTFDQAELLDTLRRLL